MSFVVNVYDDIDNRDEVSDSEGFDDLGEATTYASEKADEKNEELGGDGVDILEGAPDFIAEYAVRGTKAVVVLKESSF